MGTVPVRQFNPRLNYFNRVSGTVMLNPLLNWT